MTFSAVRFRRDALAAGAAVRRQRASTAKGRRAKQLALAAFSAYAKAGGLWASSGRARLAHRIAAATTYARLASGYASTGNRLLVNSSKLLR